MPFILSSREFLVAEGHKVRGSVLRKGDASLPESCLVCTSARSAKPGRDYEHIEKELIFLPGQRQKDFDIQVYRDGEPEFEEEFTIQLLRVPQQHPGYAGCLGDPDVAIVKILDMDT
jgi:hypothetical protein